MPEKRIIKCPFCKKLTITVLHQPFVARKSITKSRFGAGGPVFTKERTDVYSGCDACGKSLKEVEKELNNEGKVKSHEERLKRLRESGLPTKIMGKSE